MPLLQLIKEYRFDLDVADRVLNADQCLILEQTFMSGVQTGCGNNTIQHIISYSAGYHITCNATLNPDKATFQEYLIYLHKRAHT